MEHQEVQQNKISIRLETDGRLEIIGEINEQTQNIIRESMQLSEYFRLKQRQQTSENNEQTMVLFFCMVSVTALMFWSIITTVSNSFKQVNQQEVSFNVRR